MTTVLLAKCIVCGSEKLGWCTTNVCEKCCKGGLCPSKVHCESYRNSIIKLDVA